MSRTIRKVLVANRGEIALRVFRACHDLGLQTIAIYSEEDTNTLFRTAADESYLVGQNDSPLGAYLNIPNIISLAKKHGADAIHPGYGFLSENGDFARACEEAGIKFIGPTSQLLDMMGDKLSAKQMAIECDVPIIPGTTEPLASREGEGKAARAIKRYMPLYYNEMKNSGDKCENVIEDLKREATRIRNQNTHIQDV